MRSALLWFAWQMAKKLDDNDFKRHWSHATNRYLSNRLVAELAELKTAISRKDYASVIEEAADVANYAMMIADNAQEKLREGRE